MEKRNFKGYALKVKTLKVWIHFENLKEIVFIKDFIKTKMMYSYQMGNS